MNRTFSRINTRIFSNAFQKRFYKNDSSLYDTNAKTGSRVWDMRSDTVTKPTTEMLQRMATVETGDDVYGEDPSINKLERRMADLCEKEDSLFCTTGTLSNQLGLRSLLTVPPYSVVCDEACHVNVYEASGLAYLSRAQTITIAASNDKYITVDEIKKKIVVDDGDVHCAPTRVISLENTINGVVVPLEEIRKIYEYSREMGVKMHLDGARLWSASVKSNTPFSEYAKYFDTMSICFSKGLGAPVGSVLVGSKQNIKKARHFRKLLGGGWRQAGILADAASYCIDNHLPLLKHDHSRAKRLASEFSKLGMSFAHPVETNMVFADFGSVGLNTYDVTAELQKSGVLIMPYSDSVARIVFHFQIEEHVVDTILDVVKNMCLNK